MKLKFELNEKVAAFLKRALNIGKKATTFAVDYAKALALVALLGFIVLKLPEAYNLYLRHKVGSKVYMIRDSEKTGGGTGFAIKGPSGQSYILTNDHVCAVSSDKQTVLVTGEDTNMRRRIIAHDEYSDLCLIEGIPGVEGLTVATFDPTRGETLRVIGHPRLMPLHVSEGELTGAQTIIVPLGPISFLNPQTGEEVIIPEKQGGIPAEQCMMHKNQQLVEELDLGFLSIEVKWCVIKIKDAYVTSVIIHPGNSGSPVVNFWGNVEGVAFASDSTNWGRMVNLSDIKAFLKNY